MLAFINFFVVTLVAVFTLANAQCASNLGTCYSSLAGRDFSGWYQECSDKIQNQGLKAGTWKATVGNWDSGGQGCECIYTSSVPGAWQIARRSLWDKVIDKKHECNNSIYYNVCKFGDGQVNYSFKCR
ncbi:uncharacterized protein B0P05DRAFT_547052 [Gilbertella persicaria]|uniref:uncharacterized protein n=1 Tax=Gilbertella persicaria TaxID=101096 RepID=UPI00221FD4D6|nr:uncharacterized protein B0P05DRAFT_547052 [Gilbertella persicaria]KAI8075947.1 hypothetical protein B0P05DRAFT_547052 [Gilbertella persicaria]